MAREKNQDEQAMTLRLPRQMYEALRERAFKDRRRISALVREAIKEHYSLPCDCCPKP